MSRSDDSSGSSDFFSPISIHFFSRHSHGGSSGTTTAHALASSAERLPPLHDSSWIGARLSPIRSFDKEGGDDDDDNGSEDDDKDTHDHERHQALHDTLEAAPFVNPNERTSLLARNLPEQRHPQPQQPRGGYIIHNNNNNVSMIHPVWKSPLPENDNSNATTKGIRGAWNGSNSIFTLGNLLCTASGLCMLAMGIYDLHEWYRWSNATTTTTTSSVDNAGGSSSSSMYAWSWPWLVPPRETLLHFGALSPDRMIYATGTPHRLYYLVFVSSLFVCTSVVEWLLVVAAWRVVHLSSKQMQKRKSLGRIQAEPSLLSSSSSSWHEFAGIYVGAALTGQLWMWTYDTTENVIVGCVNWGTCGVLCATGMARPRHRFELFSLATMLLLLSLFLRPYASVFGSTGSAFFGWALGACGFVERPELVKYPGNGNDLRGMRAITFLGTGSAVMILSFPVLSLALRSP